MSSPLIWYVECHLMNLTLIFLVSTHKCYKYNSNIIKSQVLLSVILYDFMCFMWFSCLIKKSTHPWRPFSWITVSRKTNNWQVITHISSSCWLKQVTFCFSRTYLLLQKSNTVINVLKLNKYKDEYLMLSTRCKCAVVCTECFCWEWTWISQSLRESCLFLVLLSKYLPSSLCSYCKLICDLLLRTSVHCLLSTLVASPTSLWSCDVGQMSPVRVARRNITPPF